jgi:hypothetical protein
MSDVEIRVVNNNPRAIPVKWDDPMGAVGWKRPETGKEEEVMIGAAPVVVPEGLPEGLSEGLSEVVAKKRGRPRKTAWECPRCHKMKSPYEKECSCEE